MEDEYIDIIIENEKEQTFILEVKRSIKCSELKNIIKEKIVRNFKFDIIFRNKKYKKENLNEILYINPGEKIYIESNISLENYTECVFHKNINLNEADNQVVELSGILQLCLLKYIAMGFNNTSMINDKNIKEIIDELKQGVELKNNPKEDIKSLLNDKNGNNILTYMHYVNAMIKKKHIIYLINLFDKNKQNDIIAFWSILSKYEEFNQLFEKDFSKIIEKSYFDYSLVSVSLFQHKRRKEFLEKLKKCDNCEVRYLLHGTQIDPISNIITDEFKYAKKPFYGMGVYFTDMLDYVSFYCGRKSENGNREYWNKVLQAGETISCIGAEVFYDKDKKKYIYDDSYWVSDLNYFPTYEEIKTNYKDKMVEKNGVHFIRVETTQGQPIKKGKNLDLELQKGKLIGTEYVITEMEQILPLYGLTLKRNEYFVIWRDTNLEGKNEFSDFLKERKMFIYKQAKMNAFFESNTERALEIINRKKYNKIIIISSCGKDKSGLKFIEIARKILGFNVMVLFFSADPSHLQWIQRLPNALYTNNAIFYEKYILNYNRQGLLNLKNEVEKNYSKYGIHLNFTDDFLKFPNYAKDKTYNDLVFENICPYFRRVLIKKKENKKALFVDEKGNISFKPYEGINVEELIWYVTLNNGEITLFSNKNYLDVDKNNGKVKGFPYMVRWNYEEIYQKYFIYFKNKDKVLTINGNQALIYPENLNRENQLFTFTDIINKS